MAELTVAIRAHNDARFIAEAIRSVLQQADVELDLIVFDDGSTDGTGAIIRSMNEPRMTLLSNPTSRGAAVCYNLALERSRADFFVFLSGDGLVLPGALRKLMDACRGGETTGMAHCHAIDIDVHGIATRDRFRAQRAVVEERFKPGVDYQSSLLRHGNILYPLCLYRKDVFKAVGAFTEGLAVDPQYDMALRIADQFEITLVPEYLYCRRVVSYSQGRARILRLIDWVHRSRHCRRLTQTGAMAYLADKKRTRSLLALGLRDALGLAQLKEATQEWSINLFWKLSRPLVIDFYDWVVERCAAQPFPLSAVESGNPKHSKKVAYYTWHFPVLSQTFINRELAALKRSGIAVEVIADEPEDIALADHNAKLLIDDTRYLEPIDNALLRRYHRYFFRNAPVVYVKLFLFVVSRRYGPYKTINEDIAVFSRAVYLAGQLKDRQIDHIHSPWSDRCAFVAMLAAQLSGVTYSAQARAHDIHRNSYLYAFAEKFEPAEFVVTNTRYNQAYLSKIIGNGHLSKLKVIHNGLDLQRFVPPKITKPTSARLKLLCVARLIEQKGIIYLLQACAKLRDQGLHFDCDIIGGTEDLYMSYYLEVKKLQKDLNLDDCVRFLGSMPFSSVLQAYAGADLFVLPCVIAADGSRDITPNAILEAMAMKLPVVSTPVTGVPELVEDGVSGILVPPNDANALADALFRVMKDGQLRKTLGENGRKQVEAKFNIAKNIAEYVRLFSQQAPVVESKTPLSTGAPGVSGEGQTLSSTAVGQS